MTSKDSVTIWKARALSGFAYVVALGAAAAVMVSLPEDLELWWQIAIADGVATVVIFAFSVLYNNSSFYDPYWSVAPAVIALYLTFGPGWGEGVPLRQALATSLVVFYGMRLTYNFYRGWPGLHHEDWRYVDIREATGPAYWLVSFLGIHAMPTVLTYLGSMSLLPALVWSDAPFGALDVVAAVVTAAAITIETVADKQLHDFVNGDREPGEIMARGLWKYSRHPNYFGEILFWWGLLLFALAADPDALWAFAGPVAITLLFVFISVPLIDKRSLKRRPGYAEHAKRVSMILPLPPRKG